MGVFDDCYEKREAEGSGNSIDPYDHNPLDPYEALRKMGKVRYCRSAVDKESLQAQKKRDQMDWFTHIRQGHIDVVKKMMRCKHIDINAQEDVGAQTGLMNALIWRREEIVELLLSDPRIRIGYRNSFGKTELDMAQQCYPEMVDRLKRLMRAQRKPKLPGLPKSRKLRQKEKE